MSDEQASAASQGSEGADVTGEPTGAECETKKSRSRRTTDEGISLHKNRSPVPTAPEEVYKNR